MTEAKWPPVEAVPPTMRAATFREFGGPEVLKVTIEPTPAALRGEVLIRVAAVSLGRLLDVAARSGKHPFASFNFPHILGADHAGVVVGVGDGVYNTGVGDRVAVFPGIAPADDPFALAGQSELSPALEILGTHRPGAYAEYVSVPSSTVTVVPDGIAPEQASALALSGAVAMNQFILAGGVGPGTRVIVQGATSALGSTTALLARHLGATVVVTSRHESKRQRLRQLGFEHVFDAIEPSFVTRVTEVFDGQGANVIIDNLGAPLIWDHGLQVLAPGGAMVSSGAFLGQSVPVNLARLYIRNQRIIGVRTGNAASVAALWREVANGFRTVVDASFPLEQVADAHRYVEDSGNVGRVVLLP